MSAYFVSAETIADAAFALTYDVPEGAAECVSAHNIVSLGQVLWQLNALAMWEAYQEPIGSNLVFIAGYTQESRPDPSRDEWQRLKSLSCLIYQCAEGTVPATDLFKAMEDAEKRIIVRLTGVSDIAKAKDALHKDSRYDNAQWGRG